MQQLFWLFLIGWFALFVSKVQLIKLLKVLSSVRTKNNQYVNKNWQIHTDRELERILNSRHSRIPDRNIFDISYLIINVMMCQLQDIYAFVTLSKVITGIFIILILLFFWNRENQKAHERLVSSFFLRIIKRHFRGCIICNLNLLNLW